MKLRKKFPGCYQVAGWYILRSVYGDKKIFINITDCKDGWWCAEVRELSTGSVLMDLAEARTRKEVIANLPEEMKSKRIEAIDFEEYYELSR